MTSSTHPAVRSMRNVFSEFYLVLALVFALGMVAQPAHAAATQTFTTLTVSNSSGVTTTAIQGTTITLTANVSPNGGQNVTSGLIEFCDAIAPSCTDQNLLGTAQLRYGAAIFKFVPGVGIHSYKAVFVGTLISATSASQPQGLTVTSANPATITQSGQPGNYTLTATIAGGAPLATGSVSFLDVTNGNASLGTATLSPNTTNGIFNLSQTLSLGTVAATTAIVTGDFNGDGVLDLAVLENGTNAIKIFLGDGNGGYQAGTDVSTTVNAPQSMAVGDFNQDGFLDLVVTDFYGKVVTLMGQGNGTFSAGVTISIGSLGSDYVEAVAVGDFDGDGIPDIAVSFQPGGESGGGGYMTLKGVGDGTFNAPQGAASLYNPGGSEGFILGLAPGDFNGDGIADLAISNEAGNLYINSSLFSGGTLYPLGSSDHHQLSCDVSDLAVGDFNGDGKVDLVASCGNSTVNVLLGNGDGTFQSPVPYDVGNNAASVAVADFNGDGMLDIATANQTDNTISVLLGKGDGTFQPRATTAVGTNPSALAAGDLNGDGLSDLAVVNTSVGSPAANATVSILLNQVTATATLTNVSVAGSGAHLVDASYAGDTSNTATLSTNVVSLTGTQVPTTLAIISSLSTSAYGQQVVLTAKLTPYSSGNISTNAESVIFQSNGANIGRGSLASGTAVLNVTSLPVGTDNITAVYGGDDNFLTSISAVTTVTVAPANQKPTLAWATPAAIPYGTALSATQLNASVTLAGTPVAGSYVYSPAAGTVPAAGTDTLTVTFTPTDTTAYSTQTASVPLIVSKATPVIAWAIPTAITYGTSLSTAQLNATSATSGSFAYTPAAGTVLTPGTQTLQVTLTPSDSTDYNSASATVSINVGAAAPTLTFAPIANVTTNAAPFVVNATSASPGAVTYGVTSGPATVSGSTVTVTGAGTVVLSATEAAAGNYTAATATASFTVTAAAALDFTMNAGTATQSQVVKADGAATYTLQIAPTGSTYPDNVTFTASGVPEGASFTFSPAIVPANNGPATVNLTVQTASGQASNGSVNLGGLHNRFAPVAFSLLLLPFAGMRRIRKGMRKAVLPLCALLLLAGMVSLAGCGGSRQAQNYNITVTATSGTLQHSTTVTLQMK